MVNLLEIPSDAFEKAAEFYGKTLDSLEQDVDIVEGWLQTQPHLPELMDRSMIRTFVISNKFSIERAKQRIDAYYTMKSKLPEIYAHIHPKSPVIKEIIACAPCLIPLPKLTEKLNRVHFLQFPQIDKSKHLNLEYCISYFQMIQQIRAREDCSLGDMLIADLKYLTFDFMSRVTPTIILKSITIYKKIWSMPMKGAYFINAPPYFTQFLRILNTFITPKLRERIHVYTDDTILLETFPKRILPREYGGEEKSLDELLELWRLKFDENIERFDKLKTMTVDETLRPEQLINDDILGFHGNFKQLNVD